MLWVRAGLSTLFGAALQISRYAPLVRDLVRRYQVPPPKRAGSEWPWPVRIHSLGQLRIEVDDTLVPFGRKAQQKVLELLKALIAEGGREVDGGIVADWLWPDVDGDAAQSNLRGTVKRLRELLGHPESVRLFDGKISLMSASAGWIYGYSASGAERCSKVLSEVSSTRSKLSICKICIAAHCSTGRMRPGYSQPDGASGLRIGRVLARLSSHDESVACRLRDHALMVDPDLAAA
jgi:hypothetical protein